MFVPSAWKDQGNEARSIQCGNRKKSRIAQTKNTKTSKTWWGASTMWIPRQLNPRTSETCYLEGKRHTGRASEIVGPSDGVTCSVVKGQCADRTKENLKQLNLCKEMQKQCDLKELSSQLQVASCESHLEKAPDLSVTGTLLKRAIANKERINL